MESTNDRAKSSAGYPVAGWWAVTAAALLIAVLPAIKSSLLVWEAMVYLPVTVWSAVGHAVETLWSNVYRCCGENDWAIYVLGSTFVTFTAFCLPNLLLGTLDLFGLPSPLRQYKIQRAKNIPVHMDRRRYVRTLALATFNMSVIVFSNLALLWYIARRSMKFGYELPTMATAFKNLVICTLIDEVGFYTLHRYMHSSPFFYKNVHKIHHEWTAPCSVTAFYCHPLEQFFVNTTPLTLGPALVGCHILTAWFFWASGIVSTTLAHSGYHFPFLPSSQSHEFHHRRGSDNYGAIGLLDWLLSSNRHFKNSLSSKRHFLLLRLTPVDQLIPAT